MNSPTQPISDDQLKSFLLPVSHDLKNHLTNMYLYLQVLEKKTQTPEEKKYIEKVIKNIHKCDAHLTVISEILKCYYETSVVTTQLATVENLFFKLQKQIRDVEITQSIENTSLSFTSDLEKIARMTLVVAWHFSNEKNIELSYSNDAIHITISGEKTHDSGVINESMLTAYINKITQMLNATWSHQRDTYLSKYIISIKLA